MKTAAKEDKGRDHIPIDIVTKVLTESGYRCAVPTCRGILAIDLHHMVEVSEGGGDDSDNLLPLCPTCHALFHRKVIRRESIYAWKRTLMLLNNFLDCEGIDLLLFLNRAGRGDLGVSGDGVLRFARLIAAGLAEYRLMMQNGPLLIYEVKLTTKGISFMEAWKDSDIQKVELTLTSQMSAFGTTSAP